MRYDITPEFSQARQAWEAAYAAHDKFAEAGDDGAAAGGTSAADDASKEEYGLLDQLLLFASTTPAEIASKIQIMRSRGPLHPDNTVWHNIEALLDRIERDLKNLQRPNVSPAVAAAFAVFAESRLALVRAPFSDEPGGKDADSISNWQAAAFRAVMETPCTTPGDLIVKLYMETLLNVGDTYMGNGRPNDGYTFEIDKVYREEGTEFLEDDANEAFIRDLKDCDLGRCLIALGRVDFDPDVWLAAADLAKAQVYVVIQSDGSQGAYICEDLDDHGPEQRERFRIAQQLLSGEFHAERREAVIQAILDRHPERVFHAPYKPAVRETAPRGSTAAMDAAREVPGVKSLAGEVA